MTASVLSGNWMTSSCRSGADPFDISAGKTVESTSNQRISAEIQHRFSNTAIGNEWSAPINWCRRNGASSTFAGNVFFFLDFHSFCRYFIFHRMNIIFRFHLITIFLYQSFAPNKGDMIFRGFIWKINECKMKMVACIVMKIFNFRTIHSLIKYIYCLFQR